MSRKGIWFIVITAILSSIYILVLDTYTKPSLRMTQLESKLTGRESLPVISKSICTTDQQQIIYKEAEVEITGIIYDEALSIDVLEERTSAIEKALSHQEECSNLCMADHEITVSSVKYQPIDQGRSIILDGQNEQIAYSFTLKNQKDIHRNTYFQLRLKATGDIRLLDNLRQQAEAVFKEWHATTKESECFKGELLGKLDSLAYSQLADELMTRLDASKTNFYENDTNNNTCAYYGYCPYINEYYHEANGKKTNVQLAFHYNDTTGYTELTVAFPFYNDVF